METQSDGRGARLARPLVVALGLSLALLPAACGGLSGGGGDSAEEDPSATTVFRTITVEFTTSTSAPPDAAGGTATPGSEVTLSPNVYEVQAGDYWYGIAKKLNVDVNALWAANNADGDTFLSPGTASRRPAARGQRHRRAGPAGGRGRLPGRVRPPPSRRPPSPQARRRAATRSWPATTGSASPRSSTSR